MQEKIKISSLVKRGNLNLKKLPKTHFEAEISSNARIERVSAQTADFVQSSEFKKLSLAEQLNYIKTQLIIVHTLQLLHQSIINFK